MANLNLNRLINISVSYSQAQAQAGNFGTLLILGTDTRLLSPTERVRYFTDPDAVGAAFGATSPEALTAQAFFMQSPPPRACYVGRWSKVASDALLVSTLPTAANDPLWTQLKAITNASFSVTVGGTLYQVKPFTLAAVTGITNLKTTLTAAFAASTPPVPVTVYGDDTKGELGMKPTTVGQNISYLGPPATGTDISTLLGLSASSPNVWLSFYAQPETLTAAASACRAAAGDWFGLVLAGSPVIPDDDAVALADLVESWKATAPGLFFFQTTKPDVLNPAITTDIANRLEAKRLDYTFTTYSTTDPYLSARVAGVEFSVNYDAANSVKSVAWKPLVGGVPENLLQGQDTALESKNVNYYAKWGAAQTLINFQNGRVASGKYLDEIHGLTWFRAAVISNCYNVFASATTKVPQTVSGQARIVNAIEAVCAKAVRAGLAAPGKWTQPGFGSLNQGDTLANGYYVWPEPLDQQSDADRQARILPPVHIALKGAGNVQSMSAAITFLP